MKAILGSYIGGDNSYEDSCESDIKVLYREDNSDEDSCESNIKVLYTGETTLIKTAVKVILRFYIEADNSDEDSCESNTKVLYKGR